MIIRVCEIKIFSENNLKRYLLTVLYWMQQYRFIQLLLFWVPSGAYNKSLWQNTSEQDDCHLLLTKFIPWRISSSLKSLFGSNEQSNVQRNLSHESNTINPTSFAATKINSSRWLQINTMKGQIIVKDK